MMKRFKQNLVNVFWNFISTMKTLQERPVVEDIIN